MENEFAVDDFYVVQDPWYKKAFESVQNSLVDQRQPNSTAGYNAAGQAYGLRNFEFYLPKILYFLEFATLCAALPFYPIYFESVGLSPWEIGILTSANPIVSLVGAPLFSFLADQFLAHKLFLEVCLGFAALFRMSYIVTNKFWYLLIIVFCSEFFGSAVIPLIDSSVLDILGKYNMKDEYGKERLWGAVAWGTMSLLIGWIITVSNIESIFLIHCISTIITLLVIIWKVQNYVKPSPLEETSGPRPSILSFLCSAESLVFFGMMYFFGVAFYVISVFLFIYLADLGGDGVLFGLCLTSMAFAELPCFWFGSAVIKKLGTRGVLILVALCFAVRFTYYYNLTNPWWVLPNELLHGVTFALMWAAAVAYADAIAPPGLAATSQGILNAICFGLGGASGAILSGVLVETIGLKAMFLWSALISFILFLLYSFYCAMYTWFFPTRIATLEAKAAKISKSHHYSDDSERRLVSEVPMTTYGGAGGFHPDSDASRFRPLKWDKGLLDINN